MIQLTMIFYRINKLIFIVFSLYIMIPFFIYQTQKASHVHIMKFEGDFSIVYNNNNIIDFSSFYAQPTSQFSIFSFENIPVFKEYHTPYKNINVFNIFKYTSPARAPPLF